MADPIPHPFRRLEFRIGEVVVETQDEKKDDALRFAPEALKKAFELVAERFKNSAIARQGNLADLAIDKIELRLTTDVLLSASGAEKLADELWTQLVRGM